MQVLALAALLLSAMAAATSAAEAPPYDPAEALPGGAATAIVNDPTAAFARPVGNLPKSARAEFALGVDLFYRRWIAGPAPAPALTGLGPLYNALSCQQCHLNDGRGRPPTGAPDEMSLVLKFGSPHPDYGYQVQDRAVAGYQPEGAVAVDWNSKTVALSGEGAVHLRTPIWRVSKPLHGVIDFKELSGRIAPPVSGVGLLEAIPRASLRAAADPDDADNDGISGRLPVGRFGWRGEIETVLEQTARAFSNDMGIATAGLPNPNGDCVTCPPKNAGVEADDKRLSAVAFYTRNLGPPARNNADMTAVLAGRAAFYETGCVACHTPKQRTGPSVSPWLSDQAIWPYSDLLLHDMGAGLADAGDAEWRTPPLWGLGRNAAVNGHDFYLHDGRARSPLEAILWHGGEAAGAQAAFAALPRERRAALLIFLRSL